MERKSLGQEQIEENLEKLPLEGYNRLKGRSRSLMDEENAKAMDQMLLLFHSKWIDYAEYKINDHGIDGDSEELLKDVLSEIKNSEVSNRLVHAIEEYRFFVLSLIKRKVIQSLKH